MNGKRSLILLLVVSLIVGMGIGLCGCEKKDDNSNMTDEKKDEIIMSIYTLNLKNFSVAESVKKANNAIGELYADNPEKQEYWHTEINKLAKIDTDTKISEAWDNDPLFALQIQDDHQYTVDGNYCYVNGKVKNRSDKPISYFEVTINYLDDNGNVLDSDYTNSGQTLYPDDMKEFEIMHRNSSEYKQYELKVTTVDFE